MTANDLAWAEGRSLDTYTEECVRNSLELILNFKNAQVTTSAYANRAISKGEEVGMTYGYDYWRA